LLLFRPINGRYANRFYPYTSDGTVKKEGEAMKVWGQTDKIVRRFVLTFMEYTLEFIKPEDLEQDLRSKKNDFVNILIDSINESVGQLDYSRYRQNVYRPGLYALWLMFQDPAYTDVGIDIIQNVVLALKDRPELLKRRDPADWHINKWWQKQK